ncbi:AMP nucleosidase [Salmonella enterica subsp. enterica serovar Monophasic]|nr:AMP nucleosidase [Salmonella enterica subsp. enterica serovar Hvittingfoss]EDV9206018.1 AMP nucleosidase [Salmonella enterica subsp. enterica serovar Monophasic]
MLPSGIRRWQPEFPTKILYRKTGALQFLPQSYII